MNVLANMQYVTQQGELGRERGEQNRFRSLTPGALAGDQDAMAQQIALNPQAAQQVQSAGNDQAKRLRGAAKYMETALKSQNPAQIQGAWNAVAPYLGKTTGKQVPAAWDPAMEPALQQVLAKTAYLDMGAGGDTIQSQKISEDGFIVNTYRSGRMEKTGQKVDRQAWLRDHEGMAPQVVDKDGNIINVGAPRGQSPSPGAPQGAAPTEQAMGADMAEIGRKATEYGYKLKAAGIPAEQIDALQQDYYQALAGAYAGQNPGAVIQDGSGAPIGQALPVQSFSAPAPTVQARPSQAQTAAEVEAAKLAAQNANFGNQYAQEAALTQLKTQGQIDVDAGKHSAERATALADKRAVLGVYEAAVQGLEEGLSGSNTGPIVGRLPALTSEAQIAEGGVAAMAPILKQMFRSAGEGTFTDKDQDLLMRMVPTRLDLPEARAAKLANIDRIVRAKLSAPATATTQESSPAGATRINGAADYNALPSGATFIAPDGTVRRKR